MSPPPSPGPAAGRRFGKYRGVVVGNIDPLRIGRIMAEVPDVYGAAVSPWAMPCVPAAGLQAGVFIVPPVGSNVWIEFEQGDVDRPIWTGGFWASAAEVPALALAEAAAPPGQTIVVQTTDQNTLVLSDAAPTPASGGVILKAAGGAAIVVNDTGVYLSNGAGAAISLVGPTVTITPTPARRRARAKPAP